MEITIPHDFIPYQWQFGILADPRKNKLLVVPRKHGKTALTLNHLIMQALMPGNEKRIFHFVSPTIKQSKDIVWNPPDMLKKYLPKEVIEKKNEVELIIYLVNGSQIHVKGADHFDSLRGGNPYGVVLDEAAYMKPEVLDEIYQPILALNKGWIWLVSTPNGKNWFYNKYVSSQSNPNWQVTHLRADELGLMSPESLSETKKEMTQQGFAQEMLCEFLEGEGTIFRRIRENIRGTFEEPKLHRQYKMGVDLAKTKDFTVITVVDRHTHQLVYFDRFNQIDYNLQKSRIESIARRYNNAITTIDETGVGVPVVEDLRRTGMIVQGISLTNAIKKNIIENLSLFIEQNKMSYPEIPELIQELENYTYELLPTGNVRYTAPDGQHDDTVISLALAMWQIGDKLPLHFQSNNYATNVNIRQFKTTRGYSSPILQKLK